MPILVVTNMMSLFNTYIRNEIYSDIRLVWLTKSWLGYIEIYNLTRKCLMTGLYYKLCCLDIYINGTLYMTDG